MFNQQVSGETCGLLWKRSKVESQPRGNSDGREHEWNVELTNSDNWKTNGTNSDGREHEWNVTLSDTRKHADVNNNSTGRLNQRTSEGSKLKGSNQYPTIVGFANHQPFRYLGVINSTLKLNHSIRMSTCGLNLHHLHQIGLRLASSCDTQCHATPFYMFNSNTREYEPYVNKLQHGDFTHLRADIFFSPEQQYD